MCRVRYAQYPLRNKIFHVNIFVFFSFLPESQNLVGLMYRMRNTSSEMWSLMSQNLYRFVMWSPGSQNLDRYLFWSLMLQNLNTKWICYLVSDFTTFIQIVMWSSMLQNLYRYDMWSPVLQNLYTLLCVVYVT